MAAARVGAAEQIRETKGFGEVMFCVYYGLR